MLSFLVVLLVAIVALGTLFFFMGYGVLFISAFSVNKRLSVVWLVLLGFSSVLFMIFGYPWYCALPLWLIPPIWAQILVPPSQHKRWAVLGFWLGLVLLLTGLSILGYVTINYAEGWEY